MQDKIAIVTNSLSLGGAERISILLAEWLNSKGIEVALVTLKKDREKGYDLNPNVNRIAINEYSDNASSFNTILELRKALKEYKPTVVIVMGVPLCVYTAPALFGLNIPVIVSERNDPANFAGKKITKIISRMLMYHANGYVFQTKDAMKYYSKRIQNKATVIPNPIKVENMPKPYEGERKKRIVSAGRLVPQKNHELLITAFNIIVKQYPDYTLTIYGNGSERNKLERLIDSLNLRNYVYLPGAKNDIFNEILDAEIFVLSSDFEGMPNALIEAMALGIPVVSTDCPCGGPSSLINHMENGLLTPVGNLEKMTEAINILIDDRGLSRIISENATDIRNTLNIDVVCGKWVNFIKGHTH